MPRAAATPNSGPRRPDYYSTPPAGLHARPASDSLSLDTVEHPDAAELLNSAARLSEQGRHREAHDQLDCAGAVLRKQEDAGLLAQVGQTRAQVFLAEKKYGEARRVIERAVETLERGGEVAALAGALTIQGVVLARLGDNDGSVNALRRAVELAEWADASTVAGLAALTLVEEHGARRAFPQTELYELYRRADRLLGDTPDTLARRLACARVVMRRLAGIDPGDRNFTFYGAVHEFEEKIIGWALEESGGSVARAARLLGLKHQTLGSMLNQRHKKLLPKRTPRVRRLRSIITESED